MARAVRTEDGTTVVGFESDTGSRLMCTGCVGEEETITSATGSLTRFVGNWDGEFSSDGALRFVTRLAPWDFLEE